MNRDALANLLDQIKPFVMEWISGGVSAVGGGGTVYLDGADIIIGGSVIARSGNVILLYPASGVQVVEYAATAAGLALALAASVSGDVITLPVATITGDYTIPAGVRVVGAARFSTVLTGQITGGAGASLENCSITRTASDANALYGVVAPATGTFWLSRVHVSVSQAGAGNAAAIYSNAGGDVQVWNCSLLAPTGGAGWHYGVYLDAGGNYVEVEGGVCIGFTGATNWSP